MRMRGNLDTTQASEKAPLFSILIPVHNAIDYIEVALRSIVSQTCVDYEVILVDDGSTDGSGVLCDAFATEHDCVSVIHQENKGLLLARRVALQRARGRYIVTLDSDDALRSDALERLRDIIRMFAPDIIGFEWSHTSDFAPASNCTPRMEPGLYCGEDYAAYQRCVCDGWWISLWSKCYRRSIADVGVDYSKYRGMTFAEDLLQSIPLARAAYSFYYLADALYYYRPNSKSCTARYGHDYLDGLTVALYDLLRYADGMGREFLMAAQTCASMHMLNLTHLLVASNIGEEKTLAELRRIRTHACSLGLLDFRKAGLREDKRFEMWMLGKRWFRVLRWELMLFEAVKWFRNHLSEVF